MNRPNPYALLAGVLLLTLCVAGAVYELQPTTGMDAMFKVTTGTVEARVTRGQESWNYIYISLGFALAIGATIISMIPDFFPWNVLSFVVFTALCIHLFLYNGRFQNMLISFKASYENVGR